MRSKQKIGGIVEGYTWTGMTPRAYCEEHYILITTLDYWRRAQNNWYGDPVVLAATKGTPEVHGNLED